MTRFKWISDQYSCGWFLRAFVRWYFSCAPTKNSITPKPSARNFFWAVKRHRQQVTIFFRFGIFHTDSQVHSNQRHSISVSFFYRDNDSRISEIPKSGTSSEMRNLLIHRDKIYSVFSIDARNDATETQKDIDCYWVVICFPSSAATKKKISFFKFVSFRCFILIHHFRLKRRAISRWFNDRKRFQMESNLSR